jgi:hypothetical protein
MLNVVPGKYIGRATLVYDANGQYIKECLVTQFDAKNYRMQLRSGVPESMEVGEISSILILVEPTPHEYKCRIIEFASERMFLLFHGKERENRRINRYKVDFDAHIISLLRDGEVFALHTSVVVKVINISRNGLRLRTQANTLRKGDRVHVKIQMEEIEKIMTALVVNELDAGSNLTEYGCAMVVAK